MMDLNASVRLPCGVVLPGRTALAPMTNRQSHANGVLSDPELEWLVRRARGGFSLVSTCAAFVCEEGKAWKGQLGIAHEDHVPGLTRLGTALGELNTVSIVQLHHGGKRASLAPGLRLSAMDDAEASTRGATLEDLDRVVECFSDAAVRAERAGLSGVEVHGANGYLFTQFLSPVENQRQDDYGGNLENRARLLLRVVRAIRSRVGAGFAVGVRLSPVDVRTRWGLTLDDTCQVVLALAADGIDFLHLSLADAAGSPPFEDEQRPVASVIRGVLPRSIPLLAAGGIWSGMEAAQAMGAGVDVVAVGTAAIPEPDWPRLAAQESWTPASPPWTPAGLERVSVSPDFVEYLRLFPGLVTDGRPPR